MSARQGEVITALLRSRERWNEAFGGRAVYAARGPLPVVVVRGGLRVTVLAPDGEALADLAALWRDQVGRYGLEPGEGQPLTLGGEASPIPDLATDAGSDAAVGSNGFAVGPPDVDALADRAQVGDTSVANRSSIAFLAEAGGYSVLVPGDAPADVLGGAVRRLLEERAADRLSLSALVVPNAGSHRSMTVDFLQLLDCQTYLISTDGSRFRHPDAATIAMLLKYGRPSPDVPITLVFNYLSETTAPWSSPELQAEHNYEARYPEAGTAGIRVELRRPS